MAAACYCCATGERALSSGTGILNNPLGVCANCNILACGHHAHRDKKVPEYICVICDPSILVASALTPALIAPVPPVDPDLYSLLYRSLRFYIQSLEDFKRRRPGYGDLLDNVKNRKIDYQLESQSRWYSLFASLDQEKQRLLVAAAIIVNYVYNDQIPDDLPDYLVFLTSHLTTSY